MPEMMTRADGTTFMPVKADGKVYRQGEDKPGTPQFDPRAVVGDHMHESLYPKMIYRLMDGFSPFTDANEMNRALGHVVADDPQYDARFPGANRPAGQTKPDQKKIETKLVLSHEEELDAIDEGWGPLSNCLSVSNVTRVSKLDAVKAQHDAELAERDARLAAMEAKMEALLSAPEKRGPGRPKAA